MTSFKAAQEFYENLPAEDKTFNTIEVRTPYVKLSYASLLTTLQDGYHELVHEPNGVKEKYMDDCIAWMLERSKRPTQPGSTSSPPAAQEPAADTAPVVP